MNKNDFEENIYPLTLSLNKIPSLHVDTSSGLSCLLACDGLTVEGSSSEELEPDSNCRFLAK